VSAETNTTKPPELGYGNLEPDLASRSLA
jgi:hypothetical protein